MNPNVTKYAGQVGFDAGRYTWFDLSNLPDGYEDDFSAYSKTLGWDTAGMRLQDLLLPSDSLAIIPKSEDGKEPQYIITYNRELTIGQYTGPGVCAWISRIPDPVPLAVIVNIFNDVTNSYVHMRPDLLENFQKNSKDIKKSFDSMEKVVLMKPIMSVMVLNHKAFVDHSKLAVYRGVDNKPFINHRRRSKDKPPIYDWVTVELAPSAPRKEHQGGTHASPARHERRGHFRRYSSGKIAWVRPTWVGNIERGLIVHDYVPEVA